MAHLWEGTFRNSRGLGACRIYREAVKDHSPGLQAWVGHTHGKRPEGAADVGIYHRTAQCFTKCWVETRSVAPTGRF